MARIITIEVPEIPFKGDGNEDSQYYLAAAERAAGGYLVGGSNVSTAVAKLLTRVAVELHKQESAGEST